VPEYGIITSVMPPGGWHYPQLLDSGQSIRITGFTFEQLLEGMLDFRRRHPDLTGGSARATIERVRTDLKDYLCAHYRQNCADSPSSPVITAGGGIGVTDYQRPIDRSGDWLAKIGGMRLEKVDAALAAQRAQICATCPQNVRWATPCGPCNESVSVRIQNAKGSVHTPYDRNLFFCRLFGHINEVAVWLTDTHSSAEHQPPPVCWKHGK
jgi:hypothetical protein